MANVATNGQAGENELSEVISRLRDLAEAMRSLSGDQPGLREKLKKVSNEVNKVGVRLRHLS